MAEEVSGYAYTHEQKIVAAVWVHEKSRNNQKWKDIERNFRLRFEAPPPTRSTLKSWERKLFNSGSVEDKERSGRPISRLMHVPYVKASLEESPNLSLRERAQILGLPRTTLLNILREDLNMEFEVEDDPGNKKHAAYNKGHWKQKESDAATASQDSNQ